MKRNLLFGLVLTTVLSFGFNSSKACIDYPTTIWVSCDYSEDYQSILLTVNNLELFGGPNGAFCNCALNSYSDLYSDITYIAFVDSGTFDPIPEFEPWEANSSVTSAWGEVATFGDWNGFLSQTIGTMQTGTQVSLIVRAELPPGWTYSVLDSAVYYSSAGFDEWDFDGDSLADTHQSLISFWSATSRTLTERPQSFFQAIDAQITNVNEIHENINVGLFPNPTSDHISISFMDAPNARGIISILDLHGKSVRELSFVGGLVSIDISDLPSGIYSAAVLRDESTNHVRFVKR